MTTVIFYEKPGCINNRKQKVILREEGFQVEAHNLLTTAWSQGELRAFFGDMPVAEWFNKSAPAIQNGAIDPDKMTEKAALDAMVRDPLLIRRPLMACQDVRQAGFNLERFYAALKVDGAVALPEDIETCPRKQQGCASAEAGL